MTGPEEPWLLVSDIDDTLTGDAAALDRLWSALRRAEGRVKLALNSSRPAASVDRTLAEEFPAGFAADAVVTALGTEIRIGGAWHAGWADRFADWPRDEIAALVESLGYAPHAAEFQSRAKASFAVPGPAARDRVLAALAAAGLTARAIFSGQSDLDLIAPAAGKDAATRFLAENFGIPLPRVIAAGDSGNDLAMFEASGHAIAVGNARAELLDALPPGKAYRARAAHAAGVLEGLIRLGVLPG